MFFPDKLPSNANEGPPNICTYLLELLEIVFVVLHSSNSKSPMLDHFHNAVGVCSPKLKIIWEQWFIW